MVKYLPLASASAFGNPSTLGGARETKINEVNLEWFINEDGK